MVRSRATPPLAAPLVALLVALAFGSAAAARAEDGALRLGIEVVDPAPSPGSAAPVVGEMIMVAVRGVYRGRIANEALEIPRVEGYDWARLLKDVWTRNSLGEDLFERRLAIFPKRAGPLTIGPFVHRLTLFAADGGREVHTVTAPAITVDVAPFPAPPGGGGEAWPLSARAVEYTDGWSGDPARLPDGGTVTRTVTIRALGVLPENMPPQPALREPWLITFSPPESREVEITAAGPVSSVTWSWQLRPKTGEPGVIGAVTLPWFDTGARKMEVVSLAATPIGYAGFDEKRRALSAGGFQRSWLSVLAASAGFVLALGCLLPGTRFAVAAPAARLRARWRRWSLERAVFRAARRGAPAELWVAVAAHAAEQSAETDIATRERRDRATAALEAHLFGRPTDERAFDLHGFTKNYLRPDGGR